MPDQSVENTFLFADLAGFTALTEAMGDEDAVGVVDEFASAVRELLPQHGAEEIKLIGDAVMIRADEAGPAIKLALGLVHDVGAQHGSLSVRVGLHTGSALARSGDWFGATVNLAARVASLASGGEVLLTEQTRQAAAALDGVEFEERGRRELRNISEPVLVFAATKRGGHPGKLPVDPVCRMAVDPDHAAGSLTFEGRQYFFCSLKCASAFAARPRSYAPDTDA